MSNVSQRPTHIRYFVVGVAAMSSLLLYLDRVCISMAGTYIQQDLGLSDDQIGWVMGLFFWSYALGQVPCGWLTDRFGTRLMLTTYILSWSLLTACTGLAFGLFALVAIRLGFGLAQAGAYPTSASVVSKWVPFSGRGAASGVVAVGGRVGGAVAPFLTGYLIVAFTPLSTPIDLQPADIMDAPQLSAQLLSETKSSTATEKKSKADPAAVVGPKLLEHFSAEGKEVVRRLARYYKPDESEAKAAEKKTDDENKADAGKEGAAATESLVATLAELRLLADELNATLTDAELYPSTAYQPSTLPVEAQGLLERHKHGGDFAAAGRKAAEPAATGSGVSQVGAADLRGRLALGHAHLRRHRLGGGRCVLEHYARPARQAPALQRSGAVR